MATIATSPFATPSYRDMLLAQAEANSLQFCFTCSAIVTPEAGRVPAHPVLAWYDYPGRCGGAGSETVPGDYLSVGQLYKALVSVPRVRALYEAASCTYPASQCECYMRHRA